MKKIAVLLALSFCCFASVVHSQPYEIDVTAYKETVWKKEV